MATTKILIAGFGGQGILFSGKVLAFTGLKADKQISWLPSYGPEMRGGTASCSVTVSDEQIGSPIVDRPDVLVAMNLPSLERYITATEKGGLAIYDSSLISDFSKVDEVNAVGIPATKMANDNALDGLANMIILGKLLKETNLFTLEQVSTSLKEMIPPRKAHLLDKNILAIELGYNF